MKNTTNFYNEFQESIEDEDYFCAARILTTCNSLISKGRVSLSEILQVNIKLQKSIINKLENREIYNN